MNSWKKYELQELVSLGKEKYNPQKDNQSYKCIELEHLSSGSGRLLGYTDSLNQQSIKNKFTPGDVLFGKLRPYLRKYYLPEFEGVCSSEIWVLKANNEKLNHKYLYYLIQSNRFLQNANKSSGSKMPRADWNYLSELIFTIPSLNEQGKISYIISTWDKAIELKEKLIEQKKEQKKGLMQEVLTGNSRLKGFEGIWKQLKIKDFCKTYSGGTPSRSKKEYYLNGTIPWIKSGELNSGKVTDVEEYITEVGLKNSSAKVVYPDTILLALYGATAGVIAKCEITGTINQAILAIIPNEECNNDYLFYLLGHQMSQIVNTYTQGGQPNLNADMIKKLVVKLPSLDEQNEIAHIFKTYDEEIELNKEELKFLKLQKQALMQQLLTGKIRVKV